MAYLIREKYDVRDFGTSSSESVDYPDFGHPLANAVSAGDYELGISICGTGNGIKHGCKQTSRDQSSSLLE